MPALNHAIQELPDQPEGIHLIVMTAGRKR
jgi:hypothetical protein